MPAPIDFDDVVDLLREQDCIADVGDASDAERRVDVKKSVSTNLAVPRRLGQKLVRHGWAVTAVLKFGRDRDDDYRIFLDPIEVDETEVTRTVTETVHDFGIAEADE